MAIRNVNIIQNPEDLSYFVKDYTVESLSNLGQRFSIKGDGITSLNFTIKDIFDIHNSEEFDKPICKLSSTNNHVYLDVYDSINNYGFDSVLYRDEILYSKNTALFTDNPIKLGIRINGVDLYDANSILYVDNNTFVYSNLGVDIEGGNVELNIGRYDLLNNNIIDYLKIVDYAIEISANNEESKTVYYPLFYIEKSDVDDNSYFCWMSLISSDTINAKYGSFSDALEYIYNNYVKVYYTEIGVITSADIYDELLEYGFTEYITNELVSYNSEIYKGFHYNYSDKYSEHINTVLNLINNDEGYLYPFLREYYNEYIYKYDNNQLNKLILYSIYTEAYKSFIADGKDRPITDFELFIPIDYEFNYYCNDTDKYYIYGNQNPVSIYFVNRKPKINQNYLIENYDYLKGTLFATNLVADKLNLYNFTCNYNSKFTKIINSINTEIFYVTPYILNDYWTINNIPTDFRATGRDAGNPNIIILYVDDFSNLINSDIDEDTIDLNKDINIKVLTGTNDEEVEKLPRKIVSFNADILNKFIDNIDSVQGYTVIPDLDLVTSDVVEKFKNSIIINLTHINNLAVGNYDLQTKIKKFYGETSFVSTLWTCNDNNNDAVYNFKLINNPNSKYDALTLSEIENINNVVAGTVKENILKYAVPADNYKFSYLVFDDALRLPKNNMYNTVYPSIYNSYDLFSVNANNSISNGTATLSSGHLTIEYAKYNNDNSTKTTVTPKYLDNYLNNSYDAVNIFSKISAYEYIPNTFMPFFNLGEVLVENQFLSNRTNLFTFDNTPEHNIYYSYFGTSIYDKDKSVLHLGTYNNSPIGYLSHSLFNGTTEFNKITKVSIDIDNTTITSKEVHNNAKYTENAGLTVNRYGTEKSVKDELQSISLKYLYNVDNNTINMIYNSNTDVYNINTFSVTRYTNYTINIYNNKYNAISVAGLLKYIQDTKAVNFGIIEENLDGLNITVNNLPEFNINNLTLQKNILIDKYIIVSQNFFHHNYLTKLDVDITNDGSIFITCNDIDTPLFNKEILYTIFT